MFNVRMRYMVFGRTEDLYDICSDLELSSSYDEVINYCGDLLNIDDLDRIIIANGDSDALVGRKTILYSTYLNALLNIEDYDTFTNEYFRLSSDLEFSNKVTLLIRLADDEIKSHQEIVLEIMLSYKLESYINLEKYKYETLQEQVILTHFIAGFYNSIGDLELKGKYDELKSLLIKQRDMLH